MTGLDPPLRYELPSDALLIRGGVNGLETVRRNVCTCDEFYGRPGASVFGGDGLTIEDILLAERSLGERPKVCATTAGAMYDLGFDVEKTRGPLHYTVWLPDLEDSTILAFIDAFGRPQQNPLLASDAV